MLNSKADENGNMIANDFKHGVNFTIGRFCFIDTDVVVGNNVTIGDYTKIMRGTRIGDNTFLMDYIKLMPQTVIGNNCKLDDYVNTSGYVKIGNRVRIKRCSMIGQAVEAEDDVWIGSHVTTTRIKYPTPVAGEKMKEEWIVLKKKSMIGSKVLLLAGTTVGEGTVIGAGAVVTKDCEPNCVYAGFPAKMIRKRE